MTRSARIDEFDPGVLPWARAIPQRVCRRFRFLAQRSKRATRRARQRAHPEPTSPVAPTIKTFAWHEISSSELQRAFDAAQDQRNGQGVAFPVVNAVAEVDGKKLAAAFVGWS